MIHFIKRCVSYIYSWPGFRSICVFFTERSEYFFWDRIRIRIYSVSSFWPEYEYEYIRDLTIDRIRIRIYSLFYCGPNTNIRIFKYEYEYSNIPIFQYIIWPKSTKNWSNLTQVSVFSCVWVSESWPPYTSCIIALTDLCSRFLIFVLYYRWSGDKILINFVFWNVIIRTTVQNHRPPILKIERYGCSSSIYRLLR